MSDGLPAAFLDDTRRFWQVRTGEHVSDQDAREAVGNVAALFDLLAGWDTRSPDSEDEDPRSKAASTDRTEARSGAVS